ncbi:hypothetical protein ACE5D9_02430 [Rickettsia sp. 2024-CO-Wats]|uniref:hypothetical protein n=1 Tax=unclassified Rickettsia TaxID=114295 RepID=UPI00370D4DF1
MSNKVSTLLLKLALKKARNIINKYFSPEESLVDKRRNEAKNEQCKMFCFWALFCRSVLTSLRGNYISN